MALFPTQNPDKDLPSGSSTPQGTRRGFPPQGLQIPEPAGGWSLNEYNLLAVDGNLPTHTGFSFSNDGGKLLTVNAERDLLMEWDLAVPYDIRARSEERDNSTDLDLGVGAQGLRFNADGTRAIIYDTTADPSGSFFIFELPNPFDASDVTLLGSLALSDVTGFDFTGDGSQLIVTVFDQPGFLGAIELGTPYDPRTATGSQMATADPAYPFGPLRFSNDGNYLFIGAQDTFLGGVAIGAVLRYPLDSAYDITTIQTADEQFSPTFPETVPRDLAFASPTEAWFYDDSFFNWGDAESPGGWFLDGAWDGRRVDLEVQEIRKIDFNDTGSKAFALLSESDSAAMAEFDLDVNYNINTMSPVASQDMHPEASDFFFTPDGTRVFFSRLVAAGTITEWELSTAFSLESMTPVESYDFPTDSPHGIAFSPPGVLDGDQVLVVVNGDQGDAFRLSQGWDLGTATQYVNDEQFFRNGITFADGGGYIFSMANEEGLQRESLGTDYDFATRQGDIMTRDTVEVVPFSPTFKDDIGGRMWTGGQLGHEYVGLFQ